MRRAIVMSISTVGLAAAVLLPAATASAAKNHPKAFTEVESGARLSTNNLTYEDVYKVKRSADGGGSVVRDAILTGSVFPAHGTDVATTYYRTGKLVATEKFTLGTPNVFGAGAISGTGTCTSGTETHFNERCTYKLNGTYNLLTGVTQLTLSGTETLVPKRSS